MPIIGWVSWQILFDFFYIYSTNILFLQGGKERGLQIAELRRLASTPQGVDMADGGSKPPQPMSSKQPTAAGSRLG
jgi:hypothetical protein